MVVSIIRIVAAFLVFAAVFPVHAQNVREIVVGAAVAGPADSVARHIADGMQPRPITWNKTGADVPAAIQEMQSKPADGSRLLLLLVTDVIDPAVKNLVPVAHLGSSVGSDGKTRTYGLFAPPGTPSDVVRSLETAVRNAMARDGHFKQGLPNTYKPPQDLSAQALAQIVKPNAVATAPVTPSSNSATSTAGTSDNNESGAQLLGKVLGAAAAGKNSQERKENIINALAGKEFTGHGAVTDDPITHRLDLPRLSSRIQCLKVSKHDFPFPASMVIAGGPGTQWDENSAKWVNRDNRYRERKGWVMQNTCSEPIDVYLRGCFEKRLNVAGAAKGSSNGWAAGMLEDRWLSASMGGSFPMARLEQGHYVWVGETRVENPRIFNDNDISSTVRLVQLAYGAWPSTNPSWYGTSNMDNTELGLLLIRKHNQLLKTLTTEIFGKEGRTQYGRNRYSFDPPLVPCDAVDMLKVWNATQ